MKLTKQLIIWGLIIFAGLVFDFGFFSHAGVAKFYSQSCLGGWDNPQAAQNGPELNLDASPDQFTAQNSAVLHDTSAEIFCGDWQGDIPKGGVPKKVWLKFSWLVTDSPLIASSTPVEVTGDNFGEKTAAILDAPAGQTVNFTLTEATTTVPTAEGVGILDSVNGIGTTSTDSTSSSTTPPVDSSPPPDNPPPPDIPPAPAPAPEAPTPPIDNPTSWWNWFSTSAWATTTEATTTDLVIANPPATDDILEVFFTLDSTTWQSLGRISRSHWREAMLALPVSQWADLSKVQIKIVRLPSVDKPPEIYLDGLWLEVEYSNPLDGDLTPEEIARLPRVELTDRNILQPVADNFSAEETPAFILNDNEPVTTDLATSTAILPPLLEAISSLEVATSSPLNLLDRQASWHRSLTNFGAVFAAAPPRARVLKAEVFDSGGQKLALEPVIDGAGTTAVRISLPPPKTSFRPGKYHIRVELLRGREVAVVSADFTWGVLVVNANKSVYQTGDTAYLQMSALNDTGHTICDANLELRISGPSGEWILTTADKSIEKSDTCGPSNVTDEPDYFAHYRATAPGRYDLVLTDLTSQRQISDAFLVQDNLPFSLERVGATRINPFQSTYVMTLKLRPQSDFSGQVTESVPSSFEISETGGGVIANVASSTDRQTITWLVAAKAGEEVALQYTYQAPLISPEIHSLGPLRLVDTRSGQAVFEEARAWQIAADNACSSTGGGGNWSDSTKWTSCGGLTPQPGDTVTITNTNNITLNTNASVASVVINASATLDTDNGARVLTLTGTSGALLNQQGTFTAGDSEVVVANASGSPRLLTAVTSVTFHKLTINSSNIVNGGGVSSVLTIDSAAGSALHVQAGVFNDGPTTLSGPGSSAGTFTIDSGATFCLGGTTSTTATTCDSGVTQTAQHTMPTFQTYTFNAASTVIYLADSINAIATAPAYGNLKFLPKLTADRFYAFFSYDAAPVTIYGDFTSTPNGGGSARTLTVRLSGATTLPAAKTISISGASSGVTSMTTLDGNSAGPYAINAGFLSIASGSTLTANGSVITLNGTSGTLFTQSGTFTIATSTVAVTSASGPVTLLSAATTFNALTINASGVTVTAGAVITMSSTDQSNDKLYLQAGTLDDGGNSIVGSANGTMVMDSGATLKVGTGSIFPTNYTNGLITLDAASTVIYKGTTNQTISSVPTYGHLQLSAASGTPTKSLNGATTVGGNLTIDASNTLDTVSGQNYALNIAGTYTNNGTFTANSGLVTMNGSTSANIVTGGTGTGFNFYSLTINKSSNATSTVTTNNLGVTNALVISAGALDMAGKNLLTITSLTNAGTFALQGGETLSLTSNDTAEGTWYYEGNGTGAATTQTVKDFGSTDYYHLTINDTSSSNQDTFRTSADLAIAGNVTVASSTLDISTNGSTLTTTGSLNVTGGTLTADGGIIDANGDVNITAGTLSAPNDTMTVAGNWTMTGGTFTANVGVVTFDGTGTQTINTGGASNIFYNLNINKLTSGTISLSTNDLRVGASLSIYGGNFNLGTQALQIDDSNGGDALDVGLGSPPANSPVLTATNASAVTASGPLAIASNGTLLAPSATMTVAGDYDNAGTLTHNSGTMTFNASSGTHHLAGSMTGSSAFYNLTISAGKYSIDNNASSTNNFSITSTGQVLAPSLLSVGGNWSSSGTLFNANSGTVYFTSTATGKTIAGTLTGSSAFNNVIFNGSGGGWTFSNNATTANFTITAGTVTAPTTLTVSGNWSNSGTFTANSGTVLYGSGSLSGTMTGSSAFYNLSLAAGVSTATFSSNASTTNNFTISSGTVVAPNLLSVGGSWSNSFVFTAGVGTVYFTSTATGQTIAGSLTGSSAFYNLIFNGSGGGWTFSNNATVNSNFTITAGTVTAPASLSVVGNWSNSGTFTANSGLVTFSASVNHTLTGATTFYQLTMTDATNNSTSPVLTFPANATTTINNAVTFTGIDDNDRVKLVSSSPGTRWGFTVTGTPSINWVDVTDSDASLGNTISHSNTQNGGNNINWDFNTITFSLSANAVDFGTLTSSGPRFASTAGGSGTETVGHTITASTDSAFGYVLTVQGATLTQPASSTITITPIGSTPTASITNSEQFGLRLTKSGGAGTVTAPYDDPTPKYAFATDANTTSQVASATATSSDTTYSVYYLANIGSNTEAGQYTTSLTYILTGTF